MVVDPLLALLPLPLTLPIALIDLRRRIIPDGLNLALLLAGLAFVAVRDPSLDAVLARAGEATLAFALGWSLRALYARLRGQTGLGLGDVKFLGAATAWTGLEPLPILILIASGTALASLGLAALAGRRIGATTRLPFGPFLALGLHATLFFTPVA